jgi:hypothetical protein
MATTAVGDHCLGVRLLEAQEGERQVIIILGVGVVMMVVVY